MDHRASAPPIVAAARQFDTTGSLNAHSLEFAVMRSLIATLLVRLRAVSTVDRDERGVKDVTNEGVPARLSESAAGLREGVMPGRTLGWRGVFMVTSYSAPRDCTGTISQVTHPSNYTVRFLYDT
jgi:hypothetical protein